MPSHFLLKRQLTLPGGKHRTIPQGHHLGMGQAGDPTHQATSEKQERGWISPHRFRMGLHKTPLHLTLVRFLSLLSTTGPFDENYHGKQNFIHNPKDYKYRVMISSWIFWAYTLSLELFLDEVRGLYFQANPLMENCEMAATAQAHYL